MLIEEKRMPVGVINWLEQSNAIPGNIDKTLENFRELLYPPIAVLKKI